MKPILLKIAGNALFYIALGALVSVGIHAMAWVFPRPELKVLVCTVDDVGRVGICKRLDEIEERGVAM